MKLTVMTLIYTLIGMLVLIAIIVYPIISHYRRILKRATTFVTLLTMGKYGSRAIVSSYKHSARELSEALNQLARDMEKMEKTYLSQEDQLKTLIENIGTALIFIDANQKVILLNRSYRETFLQDDQEWRNQHYKTITPTDDINSLILETFATEERHARSLMIPIHLIRRHFHVSCAPVIDQKGRIRGVVVLFHDITDLKKLEQMRKDFVANVSHELKTPITSIIGFSETLLETEDDPALTERFLSIILYESKRLQNLVHDLLELSKIEQPNYTIPLEPLKLAPLIKESLPSLEKRAQEKEIELKTTYQTEESILGDSSRIRQIIVNLVSNAIAYTPKGGQVSLFVKDQSDWVVLDVKDTGIGIDEQEIPRIFERFYRVDRARSRELGGTGLGLAIVKHLVEAHGGKIEVKSVVGKGSTFSIYFQKAKEELN
ncbi:MAG TPA: ATP-binding protein [Sporolactobacillaceae bacterium]|nr:ATP-binding protein [Sporolactobacillaceae bacterium]